MNTESSSSQGSRPVWDTRFNRALNVVMGKKPGTKPATGRVVGGGNGATWDYYYHESTEKRKERKRMVDASIVEQIDKRVEEKTRDLVQDELGRQMTTILPNMVNSFISWFRGGQKGPFSLPSFGASTSSNQAPPKEPIMVTPNNDAPGGNGHSPPSTTPSTNPSVASAMNVRGGVSTLAQLEAVTVIKHHELDTFLLTYLYMPSSFQSL